MRCNQEDLDLMILITFTGFCINRALRLISRSGVTDHRDGWIPPLIYHSLWAHWPPITQLSHEMALNTCWNTSWCHYCTIRMWRCRMTWPWASVSMRSWPWSKGRWHDTWDTQFPIHYSRWSVTRIIPYLWLSAYLCCHHAAVKAILTSWQPQHP